ncbi:uncharacterized protein LOC143248199 [Tachypleus tridentatus]|uniref:uncharacterized protein LOC143248199 n=1 Tax=Tachypleus tridentatus TaxID=6853 RepID=UPI003FD2ACAB
MAGRSYLSTGDFERTCAYIVNLFHVAVEDIGGLMIQSIVSTTQLFLEYTMLCAVFLLLLLSTPGEGKTAHSSLIEAYSKTISNQDEAATSWVNISGAVTMSSPLLLLLRRKRDEIERFESPYGRAARLLENCKFTESCTFYDENTICNEGVCRCEQGFINHVVAGEELCIHTGTNGILGSPGITTVIIIVLGVMAGTILFCFILTLFNRKKFVRNREGLADVTAPSVVLTEMEESPSMSQSRRPSRCSNCHVGTSGSPRVSCYSTLVAPTSAGSRRTSLGSLRSQSEIFRDDPQDEQETPLTEKSSEDELQNVN